MKQLVFLRAIGRHRWWALTGVLASCVTAAATLGMFALAGWFVAESSRTGASRTEVGGTEVGGIDLAENQDLALVFSALSLTIIISNPGLMIRVLAVIRMMGRYIERIATHEATFGVLADLRLWLFRKLLPLAPARVGTERSGDLLARAVGDVDTLDGLYIRVLLPTMVALLVSAGALWMLHDVRPSTVSFIVWCLLLCGVVIPALSSLSCYRPGQRMTMQTALLRGRLVEVLQGMEALKVFGAESTRVSEIQAIDQRLATDQRRVNILTGASSAFSGIVAQGALIGVILIGAEESSPASPMVALTALLVIALFEMVTPLSVAYQQLGRIREAGHRVLALTDRPATVADPADAEALPARNDITFCDVSFRYTETTDSHARWVLKTVSFTVEEGEKLALIGESGSGKSSILSLLLRAWDPQEGEVQLGGVALSSMRLADLRSQIGLLSQRTEIFAGSLADNLLIAKPDAVPAEVSHALDVAGLTDFVASLPDGLDTYLGEGGSKISGGQARRVALARVILKDAPILLLDEPTEGLDRETEASVLEALTRFMADRTVIMITHHLEGLEHMDRALVLTDGEIAESGTVAELRIAGGPFARLWSYAHETPEIGGRSV